MIDLRLSFLPCLLVGNVRLAPASYCCLLASLLPCESNELSSVDRRGDLYVFRVADVRVRRACTWLGVGGSARCFISVITSPAARATKRAGYTVYTIVIIIIQSANMGKLGKETHNQQN